MNSEQLLNLIQVWARHIIIASTPIIMITVSIYNDVVYQVPTIYPLKKWELAITAGTVPFYRYWNGADHFYTTNINEIGTSTPGHLGRHGYTSEGTAGRIHKTQVSGTIPLYRYWKWTRPFLHYK